MTTISVFTPSHDARYLGKCYDSLITQTYKDWEWVVLLNGDARHEGITFTDPRVKVVHCDEEGKGVGYYKSVACERASGDILVELDHDDWLHLNALAEVKKAFDENEDVVFVYSDTVQVQYDESPDDSMFDLRNGWQYYDVGAGYIAARSFEPHPHNISYIWFAPNHLRSFRADAYRRVGGYNRDLFILDDQELMARLYVDGKFHHIHKALYYQRIHEGNTQSKPDTNDSIQQGTVGLHHRTLGDLALAWAHRNDLTALDLGSRHNKAKGYLGVDLIVGEGVDYVGDYMKMDFVENSVGVIRASDFVEHIHDKVAFMEKAYKELAHGGFLLIAVPSTDGRGAYQDPTHVSYWNENSFWYYTDPEFAKFIECEARFQVSSLVTYYPSDWHKANHIAYTYAALIAIKDLRNHDFGGFNKWRAGH